MSTDNSRYKKIRLVVRELLVPSIRLIQRTRHRHTMPYKDIETILKIFFPKTKHHRTSKGFYKHVFVIHSNKRKLVLKIGRRKNDIRKDYTTYHHLPENTRNRDFAKIYWTDGLFMLQKYGRKVKVPLDVLKRLKVVGRRYHLKDVRPANIMKFGKNFKIVDAERGK